MKYCPLIKGECRRDCVLFVDKNRTGNSNCRLESAAISLECIGEYFAKQLNEEDEQNSTV